MEPAVVPQVQCTGSVTVWRCPRTLSIADSSCWGVGQASRGLEPLLERRSPARGGLSADDSFASASVYIMCCAFAYCSVRSIKMNF